MNGDDRWPDVLSRRLHAIHGNSIAVVNAGIGGNQIAGPAEYGPHKPFPGGPSARQRIERDVLDLSGVAAMIWLEGINDFSKNGNATLETVQDEHEGGRRPNSRAAAGPAHHRRHGGHARSAPRAPRTDCRSRTRSARRSMRSSARSGLFDGVIDFDKATLDPQTGGLRPEFVPDSTTGGPGDKLHPNRAGYLAMGMAIDLDLLRPKQQARR